MVESLHFPANLFDSGALLLARSGRVSGVRAVQDRPFWPSIYAADQLRSKHWVVTITFQWTGSDILEDQPKCVYTLTCNQHVVRGIGENAMETNVKYEELDSLSRHALDAAEEAMSHAYNPYSRFYVGAALYTSDGIIVKGTNFETAAHSPICAERAAIVSANTQGMWNFVGMAVIGRGEEFIAVDVVAPCGVCRQMIYELGQVSKTDLRLILSSTKKDKITITSISELLPLAFGPMDLHVDISRYRQSY